MLDKFIDFTQSLFPSISPYTKEKTKEALSQFKLSGKKLNLLNYKAYDYLAQGDILEGVEDDEFVKVAKNIAHYHHEKWNGTGYPEGISGLDIPPEARIMALADVFDALVSRRCYKDKMDYFRAI